MLETSIKSALGDGFLAAVGRYIQGGLTDTGIAAFIMDQEHRFVYASDAIARHMGLPPSEVVGHRPEDLGLPPDFTAALGSLTDGLFRSGHGRHDIIAVPLERGCFYYDYTAIPIFDGAGEMAAVAVVTNDVTDLIRERNVLEAMDRANIIPVGDVSPSNFVSRAVHAVAGALGEDGLALVVRKEGGWMADHSLDLRSEQERVLGQEAYRLAVIAIERNKALCVEDATEDGMVDIRIAAEFGIRSMLVVPTAVKGDRGAALIFIRFRLDPFRLKERELAEKLAASLAAALDRHSTFEELKLAYKEKDALLRTVAHDKDVLTKIVESSVVAMAMVSGPELRVEACNERYIKSIYVPVEGPIRGARLYDLMSPGEFHTLSKAIECALLSGEVQMVPDHVRRPPSGGERHLRLFITPVSMDPPAVLLVSVDLTEEFEAKERIRELADKAEAESSRLRTILSNLPVGILIVDSFGRVVQSNEARNDVWGGRVRTEKLPEDLKSYRARWASTGIPVPRDGWPIMRALVSGEMVKGEMIDITRLDGRVGTELFSAAPIIGPGGDRIGAVGISSDITEQRKLEQEALEAKESSDMYLDLLTHDMNNHNAAIAGFVQLAMAKDTSGELRADLQRALDAVETSTELIDTVKKIHSIESHDVSHSILDLGWLLEDVVVETQALAGGKAVIAYQPALKRFVMASPLLKDVFLNILTNAIRHCDEPVHITVTATKVFEAGREYYKIITEDDGQGIPDEVKSRIFLRKYRGPTKATGTGLGLYLVKRLVEEHNGKVWVEDRVPGDHTKGAKFIVMLPAVVSTGRDER